MSSIYSLSIQQLRQAANLKEQIEGLEKKLSQLTGSTNSSVAAAKPASTVKKKSGMSAAGKARIIAAQKARWAKIKAAKPAVKPVAAAQPVKKKYVMSAAAKARWAKVKAAKK